MSEIRTKIEGFKADNGIVRASALEELSKCFRRCVTQVSRCILDTSVEMEMGVGPFEEGSLLTQFFPIGVIAKHVPEAELCYSTVVETIRNLEKGISVDARLDRDAIEAFALLYEEQRKRTAGLSVGETHITEKYQESLQKLLGNDNISYGSISGTIEKLDVHGQRKFVLYSPLSTRGIRCDFTEDIKSKALTAVEKYVTVYGKMFYSEGELLPYKAEIDDISVHPPVGELPSLEQALGLLAESGDGDG